MNERDEASRRGHIPVLLNEVLELMQPKSGGRYLDGTLGLGGHAEALLASAPDVELVGLDRDAEALERAGARLARFGDRFHGVRCRYSFFEDVLDELGWDKLDGALIDIGVSSIQLDTPERGFSFIQDGPLDMRMGKADGLDPASAVVNKASDETLRRIIGRYGEDPMGGRIAKAIIEARREKPIETTLELARLVENAYPVKMRMKSRNHPATRTFQALRMVVNKELDELEEFLRRIPHRLKEGARVAVIAFHSLEDRMVKRAFRDAATACSCPKELPVCACEGVALMKVITRKPVVATEEEREANPRARSAKLRVAERLPGASKEAEQ